MENKGKQIIFAFTLFRLEYKTFSFSEYLIRGLLYVLLLVFYIFLNYLRRKKYTFQTDTIILKRIKRTLI